MNAQQLIQQLSELPSGPERNALVDEHFEQLDEEGRQQVADWLRRQSDPGISTEHFLAEEFGRDFEAVGVREAQNIILERLLDASGPNLGSDQMRSRAWLLAEKIAKDMPGLFRREDVLRYGDLRPLIRDVDLEGTNFTENDRTVLVADVGDSMRARIEAAMLAAAPNSTADPEGAAVYLETVPDLVEEMMARADDGEIIYTPPPADQVDDDTPATTVDSEIDIFANLGERQSRRLAFMTRAEAQQLLQSGEIDVGTLSNNARQLEMKAEELGVQVEGETPSVWVDGEVHKPLTGPVGSGGEYTWARAAGKEVYTITETLALPGNMSQQEVIRLTEQLQSAGMFTRVGGEPQIPGDATDPAFKAAWRELVSMSLQRNVSMMSLLKERQGLYEEEIRRNLGTRLTDPARLRLQGDGLARSLLGRKLRDDEHEEMIEFLHGLERRNAMVEAGLDPDMESDIELDEGVIADIDARMQQRIVSENPVESQAHDTADQYDTFSVLLRGPGRGVS